MRSPSLSRGLRHFAAVAAPLALVLACSKGGEQGAAMSGADTSAMAATAAAAAHATLMDTTGKTIGEATFTQSGNTVTINATVAGLSVGEHGIHIHAVGTCEPPSFASAGGHFNPTGKQHGLENPNGPHAGDLPNFTVTAGDSAHYTATDDRITLDDGPNGLFDTDGSALVIHAGPDDNMSDPAGNSGPKVACGVITKS